MRGSEKYDLGKRVFILEERAFRTTRTTVFCTIGGIGGPERRRAGVPRCRRVGATKRRDAGLQNSSDAMVFREREVATGKLNREHQG